MDVDSYIMYGKIVVHSVKELVYIYLKSQTDLAIHYSTDTKSYYIRKRYSYRYIFQVEVVGIIY